MQLTIRETYRKYDLPMLPWRFCWQWCWCCRTCQLLDQTRSTSPFSQGKCTVLSTCSRKIRISVHVCSVKRRRGCWRQRLPRMDPVFKQLPLQLSTKLTIKPFLYTRTVIYTHEKKKLKRNANLRRVDIRIICKLTECLVGYTENARNNRDRKFYEFRKIRFPNAVWPGDDVSCSTFRGKLKRLSSNPRNSIRATMLFTICLCVEFQGSS